MKKFFLISAAALCFSSTVIADCKVATMPETPAIPLGATADFQEMFTAQTNVKSYVSQATAHLSCIHNTRQYNSLVVDIQKVAKQYNTALREFKSREDQLLTVSSN